MQFIIAHSTWWLCIFLAAVIFATWATVHAYRSSESNDGTFISWFYRIVCSAIIGGTALMLLIISLFQLRP
jgi:ABC-type iron transport system FetAB permease component